MLSFSEVRILAKIAIFPDSSCIRCGFICCGGAGYCTLRAGMRIFLRGVARIRSGGRFFGVAFRDLFPGSVSGAAGCFIPVSRLAGCGTCTGERSEGVSGKAYLGGGVLGFSLRAAASGGGGPQLLRARALRRLPPENHRAASAKPFANRRTGAVAAPSNRRKNAAPDEK